MKFFTNISSRPSLFLATEHFISGGDFFCLVALAWLALFPLAHGQDNFAEFWQQWARERGIEQTADGNKAWQQGIVYWQQGAYTRAAQSFGQAALAQPAYPLPTFYFALALFSAEQYIPASQIMRRFAGMCRDWPNMPLHFPRLFGNQDDFGKRLNKFESWLFQENRPLDTYFLFALLCQFSGDMRKAEMAYRLVLQREPAYREAGRMLEMIVGKEITTAVPDWTRLRDEGEKLIADRQYAKALEIWLSALVEYPEEPTALYHMGYALAATGYWEQAAATMRVALRRHPQNMAEQMQVQSAWLRKDSAWLTSLEEVLQQQPQNMELLFTLAYLYTALGEFKKAQIACQYLQQAEGDKAEMRELAKYLSTASQAPPPATDKKPADKKKP